MNWRRGFFRAWLVLSLCWIAGWGYYFQSSLCAVYSQAARAESAKELADGLKPGVMFTLHPRLDPVCFPTGDTRPDWYIRLEALKKIAVPPLGLLIVGAAIGWILGGFRRGSN